MANELSATFIHAIVYTLTHASLLNVRNVSHERERNKKKKYELKNFIHQARIQAKSQIPNFEKEKKKQFTNTEHENEMKPLSAAISEIGSNSKLTNEKRNVRAQRKRKKKKIIRTASFLFVFVQLLCSFRIRKIRLVFYRRKTKNIRSDKIRNVFVTVHKQRLMIVLNDENVYSFCCTLYAIQKHFNQRESIIDAGVYEIQHVLQRRNCIPLPSNLVTQSNEKSRIQFSRNANNTGVCAFTLKRTNTHACHNDDEKFIRVLCWYEKRRELTI